MLGNLFRALKNRAENRKVAPPEVEVAEVTPAGRRSWVVHPFLIAMFPIASLYAHNVYETPLRLVFLPFGIVLAGTFVFWQILRRLSGDSCWAGLATSMFVASFFGFAGLSQFVDRSLFRLSNLWIVDPVHVHPYWILSLEMVVGAFLLWFVFWRSRYLVRLTSILNLFALILVALPTMGAVSARFQEPPPQAPRQSALPTVVPLTGWTPDIYFIVLDGYARSDVMKDLYDFDNEPFLGRLERKGFFVARQSVANYCQTRLSIASTLNGDYLSKMLDPASRDLLPITRLIQSNLVTRLLRPRGYKFVTFATGFEPTDNPDSDLYLLPRSELPEFDQLLVGMTPVAAVYSDNKLVDRFSQSRDRTMYLFDRLPSVARMKEPTFTLAHIVSPHPPFIFGENGEDVSPRQLYQGSMALHSLGSKFGSPDYVRDAYRKQSVFITAQVEQAIEGILANSPEPPIIILQSDHGSWLRYHPDDLEATDLRERFGVLNCLYVPDHKVKGLDDRMSLVNTFRVVLRDVIGADLPPLADRSYFSSFKDPLIFTDVTERLHSDKERKRKFSYPREYQGLLQQF